MMSFMVQVENRIDYISIIESIMRILPRILMITIVIALISISQCSSADDDEVDWHIPNYYKQVYSGYLDINFRLNHSIHYTFYPSQGDQTRDPLLIWLTGGPGCSSLLASFYENGPFLFGSESTNLKVNDHSWNKRANLLYLQIPGGVGFSTAPDEAINDESVAQETMTAINLFLARFPAFRKSEMYLSGHGYAAVFIAYTSKAIIQANDDPYSIFDVKFNLKGVLLGNPCVRPNECQATGAEKQSFYHYEFLYNRGYYSKKMWNEFRGICALNYSSVDCYKKRVQMDKKFNETNSSMYNIYDRCYKTQNNSENYINTGCEDHIGILTFFNDPQIRGRWNIKGDVEWTPCNKKVFLQYHGGRNAYEILPLLIQKNLRIWVYSGDLDSYIPIIGTKRWLQDLRHELDMPVKKIWRDWWVPGKHAGEDQVGGFIWELRDLTFVSVKGAGYRTGFDQPQAMSQILNGFLDGKTLPYKNT